MPHGLPGINTKQGMAMGMAMGGSLTRAPSLADSANGLKRQGSKTPGTPKQKELDEEAALLEMQLILQKEKNHVGCANQDAKFKQNI